METNKAKSSDKTILIVDDQLTIVTLLRSMLKPSGFTIYTALNIEDAKVILARRPVDLLLTDLQFPDAYGLDLIEYVNENHPQVGVVVVTIIDDPEEAQKIIESGVYGYIVKPFTKATVLFTVVNAVRRQELELRDRISRREVESRLSLIMNNLHVGLILIDPFFNVVEINKQVSDWFSDVVTGEPASFLEQNLIYGQDDLSCSAMEAQIMRTSRKVSMQAGFSTLRGERDLQVTFLPVVSDDNTTAGAVIVLEDQTEKIVMERELRQAQKLEAIGQLAAGIAHEINSPMQFIGDNIRFTLDCFEDLLTLIAGYDKVCEKNGTLHESLHKIDDLKKDADLEFIREEIPQTIKQSLDGVERVSKIVKAMREFSHPGTAEKIDTDINHCIENTITVSRNEWKYDADVVTDLDCSIPLVPCLPGELNQVFLNIIVNAAHAISQRVAGGRLERGEIVVRTKEADGSVVITVSDNGGGIPYDIQHRVFDPFFTTKEIGKGTGQGLTIARGIVVEKHSGHLSFMSEEGRGTTFTIKLPLNNEGKVKESS